MHPLQKRLQQFSEVDDLSSVDFWKAVEELAVLVRSKYFYRFYQEREELVQEALCYVVALLSRNEYKPSRGSFYNYLFTAIRNTMTNYIQRNRLFLNGWVELGDGEDLTGRCYGDPLFEEFEQFLEKNGVIAARAVVYSMIMEDPMFLDIRNMSSEEKACFVDLVDKRTSFPVPCKEDLRGLDLVIWVLFHFSGYEIQVPSLSRLKQYLRRAQIYVAYKGGASKEELSTKFGMRLYHIERIIEDMGTLEKENGNRKGKPTRKVE